jgi:hypothetical protein
MNDSEYQIELDKIELGLDELASGVLQGNRQMGPLDLAGLGPITALSFPSLAIFTQLVNTIPEDSSKESKERCDNIINRAITAEVNMTHVEKFWNESLQNANAIEMPEKSRWTSIFKALGDRFGNCRPADIESFFCARFRRNIKGDVFFYGQDLYVIKDGRPMMKRFGQQTWQPLEEVRHMQRQEANCPFLQYRN